MGEQNPTLSIVITTYSPDRLKDIGELIGSLQSQTYDHILEIVFVVEQSIELRDGIQIYIDNMSVHNARIIFNSERLGICAARNLGARQAQGNIVAFTDDDALPYPDWAEEIVRTFDDESVIGVTGPAIPLWENQSTSWFPEEFYWIVGGTTWFDGDKMRPVRNAWGMNMSFRKEAFDSCQFAVDLGISQGANKAGKVGLVGDDTEFSMNLIRITGKLIIYNPKVRVRHKVYSYRLTPLFIRRHAYWQGYTKAVLKKLYGKNAQKNNAMEMETEYRLLKRILLRLLPGTFLGFFRHPFIAWKKFCLTVSVLFHFSLGYFSAALPALGTYTRKAYGSQ